MDRFFFFKMKDCQKTLNLVYLSIDRLMGFSRVVPSVDRVVSESTKQFGSTLVDTLIYFAATMYYVFRWVLLKLRVDSLIYFPTSICMFLNEIHRYRVTQFSKVKFDYGRRNTYKQLQLFKLIKVFEKYKFTD